MLLTTIACDVPRQLLCGEWLLTCAYRSGRSATYRYGNYALAFKAFLKLQRDRRNYAREIYLSVHTTDGEQIFRGCEAA